MLVPSNSNILHSSEYSNRLSVLGDMSTRTRSSSRTPKKRISNRDGDELESPPKRNSPNERILRGSQKKMGQIRGLPLITPRKEEDSAKKKTLNRKTTDDTISPTKALENLRLDDKEADPLTPGSGTVKRQLFDEDKENLFKDELHIVSENAIDHYFLQGKGVRKNRGRGARGKRNKRGEKEDEGNEVEEELDDDVKRLEKIYESYEVLEMSALNKYFEAHSSDLNDHMLPSSIRKSLDSKEMSKEFSRWEALLALGFNLLLHGVGSKKRLIEDFRDCQLKQYCTITINGFRPEVTARVILEVMNDKLKLKIPIKRRSLTEWAQDIGRNLNKFDVILLIHNLDGPGLRDPSDMAVLGILAECKRVHIVGSVDHVNSALMWNTRNLSSFNFLYVRSSTLRLPTEEIMAGESSLLGLNSKSSVTCHSLASLDVIWASFPSNSQKVFRLFFAMAFTSNVSVQFWDLFNMARDNFLVSSDVALRQILVEFEDHRIIRTRRSEDGSEKLSAVVDRELIEKFLTEKGLTLEVDDE